MQEERRGEEMKEEERRDAAGRSRACHMVIDGYKVLIEYCTATYRPAFY